MAKFYVAYDKTDLEFPLGVYDSLTELHEKLGWSNDYRYFVYYDKSSPKKDDPLILAVIEKKNRLGLNVASTANQIGVRPQILGKWLRNIVHPSEPKRELIRRWLNSD